MRLLIDTHVLLWAVEAPDRLGEHRTLLEDERNELLWSAASSWELAIKAGNGRIDLPEPVDRFVPTRVRRLGLTSVGIEHAQVLAVAKLPPIHRDPFDRLLVAQSIALDAALVSADAVFDRYDVELIRLR